MDNFKVIYKVLRYLEKSLDCEELALEEISASRLGISRERWEQILIMMQDEKYIKGLVLTKGLADNRRHIAEPVQIEITLKGLEYLAENSLMHKAANALKGAIDLAR